MRSAGLPKACIEVSVARMLENCETAVTLGAIVGVTETSVIANSGVASKSTGIN